MNLMQDKVFLCVGNLFMFYSQMSCIRIETRGD